MTSISQQPVLPPQVPSNLSHAVAQAHSPTASTSGTTSPQAAVPAAATARTYANATRKQFPVLSASGNSTPAVAGGALTPAQHGKSGSISPVNGKTVIPPAVPTLATPTIVNGNSAVNVSSNHNDHSRKPSVTISAAGTSGYMPNGTPVVGKPGGNGIQFGSIDTGASPVVNHSIPQQHQSANTLAVSVSSNPRITSPQTSPSPIPQPAASGGKPPSSLHGQGNGLSFGSLGGEDASRQARPAGVPSGNLTPGLQPGHLRHESSQSTHSEMSNSGGMGAGPGRGGYPQQAGRGRGYGPQQYPQQNIPHSPAPSFRPVPNQPRGGQNMGYQFQNQGRPLAPPYPHSPHQSARSPALAHSQPMHPQSGQMPMSSPQIQQQQYGGYAHQMGPPQNQYGIPQGFDPNYAYYPNTAYMHPGMTYMPPTSPRPPYHVPQGTPQHYQPGQYSLQQQPPSMSRTSSAISERPASSMGQPQTPLTPAVSQPVTSARGTNSPAPKSTNFQIPPRKVTKVEIRDPNSRAVMSFDKPPASPAPSTRSPAIISSTPTPPPHTPSHADTHHRTESKSVKTDEEKKNDMRDAIAKKIEADRVEERRLKEEEESKARKEKEEAEAKLAKERHDAEVKQMEEAKIQMEAEEAAAKAKAEAEAAEALAKEEAEKAEKARKEQEEEEEFARIEAEMERQEREAEERYQKKKQAEKEERARQEAEAAAHADEEMKRAEAEAEAAEERRLKLLEVGEAEESKKERADLFADLKREGHAASSTDNAVAGETPTQSGTATPLSDTSMGPPPRGASSNKQKPAALKLETSKPVEAPQPSAALQSLRSARFLTSVNDVSYPPSIASPNPALNTAAPMGKFRYDKTFLMQFQNVFVEKPSETWTEKVKETVGDTSEPSSARASSTRTPITGPRQPSRPSIPPSFSMGTFGVSGGRTLPPGTTSNDRFQASTQAAQKPSMQNPLRYFPNPPGGFNMGSTQPIPRNSSSPSLGHPQSPRGNASHRGGGPRGSKGGKPQRENDKDAKSMPITANQIVEPIKVTATGWKPPSVGANVGGMAGPPPGGDGYLAPDVVQRKVKAALNKMTPNNFDKISSQILDIVSQSKQETDGRTLRQVIQLTFEKATDEAHWAAMYAQFCGRMLEYMSPEIKDETLPLDKNGNVTSGGTLFRKYLLNRCQQEFEEGWKTKLPEKPEGESEEAVMLSDEYYIAAAAKRRGLGLVRFIGELYKLGMLTSRIMHMCVKKLVDFEGMPDEAEIESLTSLLRTIGANLDSEEKMRTTMDAYFERINRMINMEGLPSRLRFMLMDIVDLRRKQWKTKDSATKGPTTLDEVRAQAIAAEREKEMQRAAEQGSRRGGGGGGSRMGLGRGDARNFSGGGQFGPPPPQNTVGMDDLRRLGRGGSRQASSQGTMSFGPTSMFNARGSNTRRTLGPGGLGRAGEESGASSRTATPPAQKKEDKETAVSANAFSALASLESSEPNDAISPPASAASSPPVAKSTSLAERQRSKSPLPHSKDEDVNSEGTS